MMEMKSTFGTAANNAGERLNPLTIFYWNYVIRHWSLHMADVMINYYNTTTLTFPTRINISIEIYNWC